MREIEKTSVTANQEAKVAAATPAVKVICQPADELTNGDLDKVSGGTSGGRGG